MKNFNEDRPMLSAAKCRPMIVVSNKVSGIWGYVSFSYKSTEITRHRTPTWFQSYTWSPLRQLRHCCHAASSGRMESRFII